ncbi:MAG: phosphopyruvate hydratase, partial [Verrucomicrobia bacterium]|nr:phosphopyruvate hydratase [Verrucomicrobiota bacterium]
MNVVRSIDAWEILDSRGRPTIAVALRLNDREPESVSIPSGASTGRAEAREIRDGGKRYLGFGCRKAVANVREIISKALIGKNFPDQDALDLALTQLDGTPDKSNLGANAILGASLAFAKACARKERLAFFEYFASLVGNLAPAFPQLTVNLFSGGKHAFGQVAIQDLLIVPDDSLAVSEALSISYEVYQAAALYAFNKYNSRALTADEGGLSPPFTDSDEMLEAGARSIIEAGLTLGKEIKLAVDLAASHFQHQGVYHLDRRVFTSDQLINKIESWTRAFPIVSV